MMKEKQKTNRVLTIVPVSYTHLPVFYRYQEPYFCRGESVEMRVSGRFIRQIKW